MMALLSMGSLAAVATDGLEIINLGPRNTMIKIPDAESDYLLIPVEENQPISHVRVLADGQLAETFNISLAAGKVDYYVPLDLRRWKGDDLLLDVRTNGERSSMRDAGQGSWLKELQLSNTFDTANREKYRPLFHHTPPYGWMNDPNGMFYKDGRWHLYYQYNPYGSKWENMTWGHSSSADLINWEAEPIAIRPNALGAIFSGSSVVDKDNTAGFGKDAIVALYTSASDSQTQSLAYSLDGGLTFTEYNGNPVLAYERESRDPNMFWDEEHHQWVLVLASALDHEILIFNSPNLKDWTLASKFGHGFGAQNGVWECPDLMKIPVRGTDESKWVLIVNINPGGPSGGSAAQYFVGDFDGKTFTCDSSEETTKWMDYGKDHYATVSFSNAPSDRKTVVAWMSNWQYASEVPTMQFRSANSLPRDLSLFKAPDGEYYLTSSPSPEVEALRGREKNYGSATVSAKSKNFKLPIENAGICEIIFNAEIPESKKLNISLTNNKGEQVVMTLDGSKREFLSDRTKSGDVEFSENFPAVTVGPVKGEGSLYEFRLFIDRSSIEAFVNTGDLAMTNLVFPSEPYTSMAISSEGGPVKCSNIRVIALKPCENPTEIK